MPPSRPNHGFLFVAVVNLIGACFNAVLAAGFDDAFFAFIALAELGICELFWPGYWRDRDAWRRWKTARDKERSDS